MTRKPLHGAQPGVETTIQLYMDQSPHAWKVSVCLEELELPYELHHLRMALGEQKKPEYLKLNPNGKVPTLVDGELKLWESNAIMSYLATKADSDLWPKTNARYDIMRWMYWEGSHWAQAIGAAIGQKLFNKDNIDQDKLDKAYADFKQHAAVLNGHLEANKFLCGDNVTLADYAVSVWLGYTQPCELPLGPS